MIKNARFIRLTVVFCAITFLCTAPSYAKSKPDQPKGKPQTTNTQPATPSTAPLCPLDVVIAQPSPASITLDKKSQNVTLTTRYGFDRKNPKGKPPFVVVTEASAIVFDDFLRVYNNFLLKRVGPASRCDKLEIGKQQVTVEKSGAAKGYFVGRYIDRTCMFLRFFDTQPRNFDRDMFVLYSAQGITGVGNTFTPIFRNGEFSIHVDTTYQPIEEPSIFGRGGATLSGLYKEKLENFLSDPDFKALVKNILPAQGKDTNESGFKFTSAMFMKNRENKIQLTFLLQKRVSEKNACALRQSLTKGGFSPEK